jgi:hypothetical protein
VKRIFEYGTTSVDLASIRRVETPMVSNGVYVFYIGGLSESDIYAPRCIPEGQAIYEAWKRYIEAAGEGK